MGRICKNSKKNEKGSRRVAKMRVEGKMIGHVGIYRAQNIRRFIAGKGFTHRRRVSTQRHRDLHCCVLESGQEATQRRRVLHHYEPERYTVKNMCFLRNDVEVYAAAYQKVWTRVFFF